jgi:hypothetical protein
MSRIVIVILIYHRHKPIDSIVEMIDEKMLMKTAYGMDFVAQS